MTLQRFEPLVRRQWRLIVFCIFVAGVGAFVVSQMAKSVYVSSAIVQVTIYSTSGSPDINGLQASNQLARTDAQLATSYPVLQAVASHYADLTEPALANEVSAAPRQSTQLFEIDVQDTNPERAASLANDIANTLLQQQTTLANQSNAAEQEQIQRELNKTRNQIDDTINLINTLQGPTSTLPGQTNVFQGNNQSLQGNNQTKIAVLQAQLTALQQHYSQWQTLLAQVELSAAQSSDFLRVVQPAQPNYSSKHLNTLLITFPGMLLGFFLGMLLAFLCERLDAYAHTPDEVKNLLEWPAVGTIWRADERAFNPHGYELNAEAYRILRTNIGFSSVDRSLRTMVVTSAVAGEGKSTVAANLAIFMARAGKNTLLIDADLRYPVLHTLFQMTEDKPGLSNAVLAMGNSTNSQFVTPGQGMTGTLGMARARIALESFFHYVGLPNLRVMPSGPLPPNPSELLDSRTMQRLISVLENSGAEIIIFDAPPVFGLADTSILAAKVDGTLVVVDPDLPTKAQMKQMKVLLQQARAHVVGFVVNKQRPTRQDVSYYDYSRQEPQKQRTAAIFSGFFRRETPVPLPSAFSGFFRRETPVPLPSAADASVTNQADGLVNTANDSDIR